MLKKLMTLVVAIAFLGFSNYSYSALRSRAEFLVKQLTAKPKPKMTVAQVQEEIKKKGINERTAGAATWKKLQDALGGGEEEEELVEKPKKPAKPTEKKPTKPRGGEEVAGVITEDMILESDDDVIKSYNAVKEKTDAPTVLNLVNASSSVGKSSGAGLGGEVLNLVSFGIIRGARDTK